VYLEIHTADILSCNICSFKYCRGACPVYDIVRSEGIAPSGFNHYALGILKGMIHYTPSAAEQIYKCTTCGACRTDGCVVPGFGDPIDTPRIIEAMRAEIVEQGMAPQSVRALAQQILETGNPYGEPPEARGARLSASFVSEKQADILYFMGCAAGYRHPAPAQAALRLLEKARVSVMLLGNREPCCGLTLFSVGERKKAAELACRNVETLQATGVQEVIFSDAGCYRAFKKVYPEELEVSVPFKVYHITEYLERLVLEDRLTFKKKLEKKVTYHDPCNLGIQSGVYEAPRNLLGKIPGLKYIEMKKTRDKTRSVGVGGGFEFIFPEMAKELALKRIEEAKATEAEILVSACPAVEAHLTVTASGQTGLLIQDITELLVEAL
jgi:heterodisulfide reductase subunit D